MSQDAIPAGSFVCICGRSFPSEMALEDHARQAHGSTEPGEVEAFVCPECQSTFGTFAQLRDTGPRTARRRTVPATPADLRVPQDAR